MNRRSPPVAKKSGVQVMMYQPFGVHQPLFAYTIHKLAFSEWVKLHPNQPRLIIANRRCGDPAQGPRVLRIRAGSDSFYSTATDMETAYDGTPIRRAPPGTTRRPHCFMFLVVVATCKANSIPIIKYTDWHGLV